MMTNQRLAEINGEMINLLIAVKAAADAAFRNLEGCESAGQGYDILKTTVDAIGNAVVESPYYTVQQQHRH